MTRRRSLILVSLALIAATWTAVPVGAQHSGTVPTGPTGFNTAVNYNYDNFAYSPNIRKFVDSLPGLGLAGCALGTPTAVPPYSDGTCNANDLGQYIPIAAKSNPTLYGKDDFYNLGVEQYALKMHSDLPPTTIRGYYQIGGAAQYLGPLIVAKSFDPSKPAGDSLNATGNGNGAPTRVLFQNNLPLSTWNAMCMPGGPGNLFLPVDPTLMGAGMGPNLNTTCMGGWAPYTQNRIVIHLHGGATPWISDGTPDQWVTPANQTFPYAGTFLSHYQKGDSFQNAPDMIGTGKSIPTPSAGDGMGTLYWSNQQSQRLMFFHDHAYGITRLNVYAGMAAGYLLHDQVEDDMIAGTNVSGAFGTAGLAGPVLPNLGPAYIWGIPLIIQDRSFVNDATVTSPAPPAGACRDVSGNPITCIPTSPTLTTDPLWSKQVPSTCGPTATSACTGGNFWFPHEYMPNENIFDPSGALDWGRWDYGPWLNPPLVPLFPVLPSPSHVPETFADTMLVNGTPYPYVQVPAGPVRFRILSVGNDRALDLQLYVAASKNTPTTPGTTGTVMCDGVTVDPSTGALPLPTDCTEVKMVPATNYPSAPYCTTDLDPSSPTGRPSGCTPSTWPTDGRNGGVPDPTTAGPQIIQIGNEGGILPQVVTIPTQPIDFEYSRRVPVVLNVKSQSLLLMPAERADIIVDFSAFAGKTLILYNDAPAPMPLYDERNDLYTGSPDWRAIGGAPSIPAGYGPNTRTVMQIQVASVAGAPFDLAALQTALPQAYKATQAPPIVPQAAYNTAFGTSSSDTYVQNVDATVNLTGNPAGNPVQTGTGGVRVTLPGSGFLNPPTVSFASMDGFGSGAIATACLNGVSAITVTANGAGYTTAPAITWTNPVGVTPTIAATAQAILQSGGVSAIAVTVPGCGYATGGPAAVPPTIWTPANPTITIAAPPCTINTTTCIQATATANVTGGAVGTVTVTNGGSGYHKAPFVFLNPVANDPGRGATADAMLVGDTVIGMKNITEGFEPWYGRMNVQLGTTPVPLDPLTAPKVPGIAMYIDPPSDYWNDGQPQVFRVAHLGVDSHIIHFHLANLQVVNRVDFTNTMYPPLPNEVGWKESIRTNPFTDLILAVKPVSMWLPFQIPQSNRLMDVTQPAGSTLNYIQPAPVGGLPNPAGISNVMTNYGWEYVWHCHLLGHEENDMMRPIVFNVAAPTTVPSNLRATVAIPAVNLTWMDADTSVRTFRIQRSSSNTFPANVNSCNTTTCVTFFDIGAPPATKYADTSITSSGTYYYRVRAEDGAGVTGWSNTASVRVTAVTAPSNVTATLAGTPTVPAVRLTWTNGSNAASITVQRTPGFAAPVTLAANATSYTDSTVALNGTYSYVVCTVNAAALGSPACSAPVPITVAAPAAPSNVAATAVRNNGSRNNGNKDTLTVTWMDNSNNESGFAIRWSTDSTFATGVSTGTVGANVTRFTTNVSRALTLYVQVQATNPVGVSGFVPTPPVSVTTP